MTPRTGPSRPRGFTLLEFVFVCVILGALTKYALMRWTDPAVLTMAGQAEAVAEAVRRAQSLAMTRGQRIAVTVATSGANGVLRVACTAAACDTDRDLRLSGRVELSGSALYFSSQGMPINVDGSARNAAHSFTLAFTPATGTAPAPYTVSVAPSTGRVVVSR